MENGTERTTQVNSPAHSQRRALSQRVTDESVLPPLPSSPSQPASQQSLVVQEEKEGTPLTHSHSQSLPTPPNSATRPPSLPPSVQSGSQSVSQALLTHSHSPAHCRTQPHYTDERKA